MPQPRTPLPADLGDPFTVAGAKAAGVTLARLRGRDLTTPTSGVRRPTRDDAPDLALRAQCLALALPDDVAFSHLTAARLLGLPTPRSWPGPSELLDVIRETDRPRVERTGCRHHRGLESRAQVTRHGLRAIGAVDTWCDVASTWAEPDLLAAADVLLRRGWASPPDLAAAVDLRRGTRGVVRMRSVAPLARARAASPRESHARWWFHVWGLPEPQLNKAVHDVHGQWLATVDFRWRTQRVVAEYDGDVHRTDRRAWLNDKERRAAIEDGDWRYVEMTARSLSDWAHREALRRRLARHLGG